MLARGKIKWTGAPARRVCLAIGFLCAFVFLCVLFWPKSETSVARPLSLFVARIDRFVPAPFRKVVSTGAEQWVLEFDSKSLQGLTKGGAMSAIVLPFATYGRGPWAGKLELKLEDQNKGRCYFTNSAALIGDNVKQTLSRDLNQEGGIPCDIMAPTKGTILFTPHSPVDTQMSLAIWSRDQGGQFDTQASWFFKNELGARFPIAAHLIVDHKHEPISRGALLAFQWNIDTGWMISIFVTLLSFGLGGLLLSLSKQTPGILGSVLLLTCFLGLHAVSLPPLQGPDEPNHLLSYAQIGGSQFKSEDVLKMAQRVHFNTIRSQEISNFAEVDRSMPANGDWLYAIYPYTNAVRSPTMTALWQHLFVPLAEHLPGETWHLNIRILTALLTLLLASVAFFAFGTSGFSLMVVSVLAFSPLSYFFPTNFSNYSLVVGLSLIIGMGSCWILADSKDFVRFFILGAASLGAVYSSLSLAPLVSFVPIMLFARELSAEKHFDQSIRKRFIAFGLEATSFFLGWTIALVALKTVVDVSEYEKQLSAFVSTLERFTGNVGKSQGPFSVMLAGLVLFWILLPSLGQLLKKFNLNKPSPRRYPTWLQWVFLVLPVVAFLMFRKTVVSDIEFGINVTRLQYTRSYIQQFFGQMGLSEPSWFGYSLYGLFGAVDRRLPEFWVRAAQGLFWLSVCSAAWNFGLRLRNLRASFALWISLLLCIVVPFFALAWGNYGRAINLHGRYLQSIHLFMWCFVAFWLSKNVWEKASCPISQEDSKPLSEANSCTVPLSISDKSDDSRVIESAKFRSAALYLPLLSFITVLSLVVWIVFSYIS